ncbi:MAG: trp operon repressor [Treponema sp.]|jgi:TrpR family trp operon transcriptional repressor|nr:trp operon repressor [Treponema sp.]
MRIDDPRITVNVTELAAALAKTDDAALIELFLRELLTPAETAAVAARWALVKALKEKKTQRAIAKDLGLSLCKITRGSRELKRPNSAFQRMLDIAAETDPEGGASEVGAVNPTADR